MTVLKLRAYQAGRRLVILDLLEVERRLKAREVPSPTSRIARSQPEMQHVNPLLRAAEQLGTSPETLVAMTDFASIEARLIARMGDLH